MPASPLKDSYCAGFLAQLKVPGFPASERRMRARLDREGIPSREVECQGGKNGKRREYWYPSLPMALKLAIGNARDAAAGDALPQLMEQEALVCPASAVTGRDYGAGTVALLKPSLPESAEVRRSAGVKAAHVADMRLSLLRWLARRAAEHGLSLHLADKAYRAGRFALPPSLALTAAIADDRNGFHWTFEVDARGSFVVTPAAGCDPAKHAALPERGTLFRWVAKYERDGWAGLVPKYRPRDMGVPAWAGEFLRHMQRPQKPSVQGAYDLMLKTMPKSVRAPSYRTVVRWYAEKYSNLDRQRGRNTGSAMNPYKFHHKRTSDNMLPGDEVHSDGWSTHFLAPHPVSGKFVKLEVWHSHDVPMRYVYPPSVGLSESATVILGSIANVIATDGVPAIWQTDNTGSVKNDRVEFDPAASIAARAGMEIVHNIPGNSQANGIAEEFGHYLDVRARELATYQGKEMDPLTGKRVLKITQKMIAAATREEALLLKAEAERIGKGLVFESYAQAVEWLRQIFTEYNDRPHRSLPKITTPTGRRHMSPNEMRARFIETGLWKPAPLDTSMLADLMHVHERKKVVRGCVSVFGQRYHHADLDHINGEDVLVAYDINDGGRVWVKNTDGDAICEAKFYESRSYRALSFMELALEKRADAQQRRLQRKIDDIEAQRPGALIDERAEGQPPSLPHQAHEITEAPPVQAIPQNLVRLSHMTPNTKRAMPLKAAPLSPADEKRMEDITRELTGARRLQVPTDLNERYAWHVKLAELAAAGARVPAELQDWFASYGASDEYRRVAGIFAEFGMDIEEYASDLVLEPDLQRQGGPRLAVA